MPLAVPERIDTMSDKDNRIAELEAELEALRTTFGDLLAVCFAEVNEHAKHHEDEMTEAGTSLAELIAQEAHLIGHLEAGELTAEKVVDVIAEWLGHSPVPSKTSMLDMHVMALPLGEGQTINDLLKQQLDNEEIPAEIREVLNAMLSSGQVDQADAKLRDIRNQGNAHLN